MGFLNPWLLLGTLGVSVPIIIHLLNRYRHKRVDWGAMELLRKALEVRSRQVQIEDLILLIMRCLAVLLIALAIARPTITSTLLGKNASTGVVIAIDASYSMAHRPGVSTRLELSLQRARDVMDTLNSGDPLTLVVMGNQPRILLRGVGYNKTVAEDALKHISALGEELKLEQCLTDEQKGLKALMFEMKAPSKECYIISDAQELSWGHPSDVVKQAMASISSAGKLYVLTAGSTSGENLGLTRFELGGGAVRKGAIARFDAEVRNFGHAAQKGVAVDLFAGETRVDRRVIETLNGGQTQTVPLYVRFDKAGTYRLCARLGQDALAMDNSRYAAVTVRDQIKVLLVDGRPSSLPYQSATAWLATALAPKHGTTLRDSIVTKTISWLDVGSQKLTDFDLVILADVGNLRTEDVAGLYSYVQQGGGMIFFCGPDTGADFVNKRMQVQVSAGQPAVNLLPAELVDLVKADAANPTGWSMEISAGHPLTRAMARLSRQLLDEARFTSYMRTKLYPDGRAILTVGGDASPLLAEKVIGQGKVLLMASSADREWSNFIIHPAGPMWLHDAVTYLTTPPLDRPLTVGDKLVVTLPRQFNQPTVVIRDPSGKDQPLQVTETGGRKGADFGPAEMAGFYEIQQPSAAPLVTAANVPAAEGDVRAIDPAALSLPLAGTGSRILSEGADVALTVKEARVGRELWRWLMGLALAILVAELVLARYFQQRMARTESTVSAADRRERMLSEKVA